MWPPWASYGSPEEPQNAKWRSENQNVKNKIGKGQNKNQNQNRKAKWRSENQNIKNKNGKVKNENRNVKNKNRKVKNKNEIAMWPFWASVVCCPVSGHFSLTLQ